VNRQANLYQIRFALFHSGCSRFPGRNSTSTQRTSVLRKDQQQNQFPSETSDRRKAGMLRGFHETNIAGYGMALVRSSKSLPAVLISDCMWAITYDASSDAAGNRVAVTDLSSDLRPLCGGRCCHRWSCCPACTNGHRAAESGFHRVSSAESKHRRQSLTARSKSSRWRLAGFPERI